MSTTVRVSPSPTDILVLNILRCEPPTLSFDFFGYGGLTQSVFTILHDMGLEKIISENAGRSVSIPSSSSTADTTHSLTYERKNGSLCVLANTHNNFSHRSDAKFLAIADIIGSDGNKYQATALALEVYREKGNPIWELGFYITKKGEKNIIYGEQTIIKLPETYTRVKLFGEICKLFLSMGVRAYDPSLTGIVTDTKEFRFLNTIFQEENRIDVITREEFEQNRAKWFRYLAGTLDVKRVLKFEDRHGYKKGYRNYRIELVSTHLDQGPEGQYYVDVLANTEGDPENPNEKQVRHGPYSHKEALEHFLRIGNHYLTHLHINIGKDDSPFRITRKSGYIDFRYATIIKDSTGTPITLSSWSSPYSLGGRKLPYGQVYHYLGLWNGGKEPLRLDEGIDFKQYVHPRTFMGKLLDIIPQIEYKDGTPLLERAREQGILLNPSA